MTPAEIAALRALYERIKGYRGFTIEESDLLRAVPALLSALEEARAEIKRWEDKEVRRAVDCCGQEERALAAESRADALQRERDEMEKSKWYERDRRKEAEARADALQAEVERLRRPEIHDRLNDSSADDVDGGYSMSGCRPVVETPLGRGCGNLTHFHSPGCASVQPYQRKGACNCPTRHLQPATARADAAWRAALEAAVGVLITHVPDPSGLNESSDYQGGEVAEWVSEIRALPPPSATPNEET